jgi:hypothetical protein
VHKAADGLTVRVGLRLERRDVPQGVGGALGREVLGVGRLAARRAAGMGLDEDALVVEADGGAIGAGAQTDAQPAGRERVEGRRDERVVVATDLRRIPQRGVIRLARGRAQGRPLLGLEVLPGPPLGP